VFEQLFEEVVAQCLAVGLVRGDKLSVDGTPSSAVVGHVQTPVSSGDLALVAELLRSCGSQDTGTVRSCTEISAGTNRTSCAFLYSRTCGSPRCGRHSSAVGACRAGVTVAIRQIGAIARIGSDGLRLPALPLREASDHVLCGSRLLTQPSACRLHAHEDTAVVINQVDPAHCGAHIVTVVIGPNGSSRNRNKLDALEKLMARRSIACCDKSTRCASLGGTGEINRSVWPL